MLISMEIPTREPAQITAGDTVKWTKTITAYPADLYALNYRLIPASGGTPIELAASADGTDHSIAISAADSAEYDSGDYRWYSYVIDLATNEERYSLESGALVIAPNPAADSASDLRSHARKVLAAIEALLEGQASVAQEEIEVDGDKLKNRSVTDLLALRSFYVQEAAREAQAEKLTNGLQTNNIIRTRFL